MSVWSSLFRAKQPARVRAATQSQGGGTLITTSSQLEEFIRTGGVTASGVAVTPETAMANAAVYRCVSILSDAPANLPFDIKERIDADTRADRSDHPVWFLLNRQPNNFMAPTAFRRMLQMHILLRGNAYARIVRGAKGDVISLLPLHPDRVKVMQAANLDKVYEYKNPSGATTTYQQRDVLHLMGLTFDGVTGVSVIRYAREMIGLSQATQNHGSTFFRNGTSIGSVLTYPEALGPEGISNLQASLEKFRAGGESEGKTLVLEEGGTFQNIGMTAEDAQLIQAMGLTWTGIAMFFGVPPHMIGMTEKSTSWGTGIEQQTQGFITYVLEGWFKCWEDAVNGQLLDPRQDVFARLNRNAMLRGDSKARFEAHVAAIEHGMLNPNEARALEDWNPREGGDAYWTQPNLANKDTGNDKEPDAGDQGV